MECVSWVEVWKGGQPHSKPPNDSTSAVRGSCSHVQAHYIGNYVIIMFCMYNSGTGENFVQNNTRVITSISQHACL